MLIYWLILSYEKVKSFLDWTFVSIKSNFHTRLKSKCCLSTQYVIHVGDDFEQVRNMDDIAIDL